MRTPAQMEDIKAWRTGLTRLEAHEACNESAKLKEIEAQKARLGVKYLCHPANAPERGTYHPTTGLRLA